MYKRHHSKCPLQGHNTMAQLGFKPRHFDRQSQGFYPLFCKAEVQKVNFADNSI